MISGINSTNPAATAADPAQTTAVSKPKDIDKNMFLQLMVAQLRNQDPMKPSDGTAFLGQLAQFQQLEQGLNAGQDIAAIRADLERFLALNTAS